MREQLTIAASGMFVAVPPWGYSVGGRRAVVEIEMGPAGKSDVGTDGSGWLNGTSTSSKINDCLLVFRSNALSNGLCLHSLLEILIRFP